MDVLLTDSSKIYNEMSEIDYNSLQAWESDLEKIDRLEESESCDSTGTLYNIKVIVWFSSVAMESLVDVLLIIQLLHYSRI